MVERLHGQEARLVVVGSMDRDLAWCAKGSKTWDMARRTSAVKFVKGISLKFVIKVIMKYCQGHYFSDVVKVIILVMLSRSLF